MTITKLAWRDLVPDTDSYQEIFAQPHLIDENDPLFSDTQPRLQFALEQLLHTRASSSFMLAKAPEESEYLNLIANAARTLQSDAGQLVGGHYEVSGHSIRLRHAVSADDNFATLTQVVAADWVEAEQLFGCLRQFNGDITLAAWSGASGKWRYSHHLFAYTAGATSAVDAAEKYR